MNWIHLFPVYPEIFPVFSYDKTFQHSIWKYNLTVDWSSGWILSCLFGCERKIHKPKPWINQACKEIHTATLSMKPTSVVCKLEIKINLSKSKVKLQPYSKSISTKKCVFSPLFKINLHHQEIFPVVFSDKTSQHSKWMDNLNVDWSSGWILPCFFGCEGKIHKPKPWINQECREIHTATLGMKLTSVLGKLEIKINLSKSKVKLHPYSRSISSTKCVISPLFKITMHHQIWNRAPTPNRYAPPARTWTRGFQHVNWVCRPLHQKSLTLSS